MRIAHLITFAALASLSALTLAADPTPAPAAASKSAPPAPSDEKQLEDLEQQWLDTSLKQDHAGLDAILMDDFEDVSWQGELRSKTEIMAIAMAAPVTSTQTLSDLKVRVHGDTGVVTGVNTAEAADKSFTVKVRFTDVFVKDQGKWRALSAQETIEKSL
ncbi:MAG TPA: nuclear transport factor 2 family protein [Gammaproteobacteria bacterium]|jgi:ketosteroid isomerase-like protein